MKCDIYIGSDHAGFKAKQNIIELFKDKVNIIDLGVFKDNEASDYPDIAKDVAEKVRNENRSLGILICGTGIGMQIAANKIQGIRAAFCYDIYSAVKAREHNDANILTLRAREFNISLHKDIVSNFINTSFSHKKRHEQRIAKIRGFEKKF